MKYASQYNIKPKYNSLSRIQQLKPEKYKHYMTIGEVGYYVRRDPVTIRRLERQGLILAPARVLRGNYYVRLYSPAQAEELKKFFEGRTHGWRKGKKFRERKTTNS